MRKLLSLCTIAALAVSATPVLAQDMAAPAASTDTISNTGTTLRGFRIEGDAGGDRYQSQGVHRDKFGYGATIGFDGQIGDRIVIGPEATYWRANDYTENCTGTGGGTLCNKSFDEFGVGVRAGRSYRTPALGVRQGRLRHQRTAQALYRPGRPEQLLRPL